MGIDKSDFQVDHRLCETVFVSFRVLELREVLISRVVATHPYHNQLKPIPHSMQVNENLCYTRAGISGGVEIGFNQSIGQSPLINLYISLSTS